MTSITEHYLQSRFVSSTGSSTEATEQFATRVPLPAGGSDTPPWTDTPLYSSIARKGTERPTLAEIAAAKTSNSRPASPAYTNVSSPASQSGGRRSCRPTPPSRTSSLKRSTRNSPPSRKSSVNRATRGSLHRNEGSFRRVPNGNGTVPDHSILGPDHIILPGDQDSADAGNIPRQDIPRPAYTTIPSYPSANSLLLPQQVKYTQKESSSKQPGAQTQRSYTSSADNIVNLNNIQGAPTMYGRHYRAFRDSRRPDRPGGIVYLKFNQQDFYELLDECDSKRRPFNDRSFPPDISSLCYIPFRNMSDIVAATEGKVRHPSKPSSRSSSRLSGKEGERSPKMGHIVWKRPKELNPRSRLLSGGKMFRGDLVEGVRGTPNFGAACSALALKHELLFQVMPDDQCPIAFEDDWGIYKFRFWRYGNWTEVTIDDKLPSVGGELLYTHTVDNDEHWMCVMEKAYAKFNGCYDIISKIPLSDMLQHLTGGITETLTLTSQECSEKLGHSIESCFKKRALILANAIQSKEAMMLGLDSELPYIVTRVKRRTRAHPCLVCLYSPFGASGWAGPWGRDSPEWRNFSHEDVYNYGLMNESDFDFWISVEDLVEFFETVNIAHQSSDTMAGIVQQLDPSIVSLVRSGVYGNWIKDKTDGGAPNNNKFLTHNVQYLITQQSTEDNMCVISLVQRYRPRNTPHEGFMCIGFSVFKAPENIQYRMTDLKDAPVAIATYSYKESISVKTSLEPGNYVIIPTSYQPGVIGEYLLRCVSPSNLNIRALKQAPPSVTKKQVVDVELICGENLPDITHISDADPDQEVYCVIQCGKEKCHVPVKHGPNPVWNSIATFHAKRPYKKTISVQVWYKPGSGLDLKEDMCLAETCQLPIITGDHKVVSQLSFSRKSSNKSATIISKAALGNKKKAPRCAGAIVLIVRYNPLPTVFRGLPKAGSNVQVVSLDRGRQGVRLVDTTSNSDDSSSRDRKCRTEPRGGGGLVNHTLQSDSQASSVASLARYTNDQRPSTDNLEQIFLPTATLNREQLHRNSPRRQRHHTDEEALIANRSGMINSIKDLSMSRHQRNGRPGCSSSLDDLFDDDRPVKFNVNSDKTLSPEHSLRGMPSEHSLKGGLPCALPPYQYASPVSGRPSRDFDDLDMSNGNVKKTSR